VTDVFHYPLLGFVVSVVLMGAATWIGLWLANRQSVAIAAMRDDFNVIQTATLTLLGLIIGFTFSMAIGRYDQRKNYEEEEANAIGTEWLRAELLPAADAAKVRGLLRSYLDQRIRFYKERDDDALAKIDAETARLQGELWSAVRTPALAQPTPLSALAVAGMNDVLNTQGYTQAAWWNRIPPAAWALMAAIALCANVLVGLGATKVKGEFKLLLVLPLILGIAFFLIADIDSPRRGVIRVVPQNLHSLEQMMRTP
jgi:hypothetical protein